jgi:hypothetical protein
LKLGPLIGDDLLQDVRQAIVAGEQIIPIRFGLGHLGLDAIGWNAGVAVISAID